VDRRADSGADCRVERRADCLADRRTECTEWGCGHFAEQINGQIIGKEDGRLQTI
jgi:hypothetical protein